MNRHKCSQTEWHWTDLDGGGLQQGNLVLSGQLQEAWELLGEVHDLLDRHDGQLREVGEALLAHLPVLRVLAEGPGLHTHTHTFVPSICGAPRRAVSGIDTDNVMEIQGPDPFPRGIVID